MLNEIWRLFQALERSEIKRIRKHKRIQVPGRTFPCIRVCLSEGGKIHSIQDMSSDEWPAWTVMEGNQSSFPVVRVQEPLIRLQRGDEVWTKLGYDSNGRRRSPPSNEIRLNVLENLLKNTGIQSLSKKTHTLWRRLRDQKAKELLVCAENDPQLKQVASLARYFMQSDESPAIIMRQIADGLITRISQGRLHALDFVEKLLVGKGPPNLQGRHPATVVQIAFDIEDTKDGLNVYSDVIRDRLVEKLPQDSSWKHSFRKRTLQHREEIDAFTGNTAELERETFPKVYLPVPSSKNVKSRIGRKPFPLVSMFNAAHCNKRYGMTDANVFPLAKARSIQLKEALEEITADSRREKTWQYVSNGREKPDLLIAYVEERPMIDVKTAGYFGQGQDIIEAKFEVDSAVVCEAFRGIVNEKPQSKLNLFLIREVSKGQIQVVLAESPTVKEVLSAAERWQRAARENVPDISLYLPPYKTPDKGVHPEIKNAIPIIPYPDQVVRLLSYQWIRDGSTSQPIIGPGLGDVLTLMLQKDKDTANQMLDLLIRRVSPLLLGVFAAKHAFVKNKQEKPRESYHRSARETALRAIAVLGILFNTLDIRKEDYVKGVPYQIGQVLSLADTLHKDYCVVVRGQKPNSFIGTSLMRRALDSPAAALADLSERIVEYIRWAKVANDWPQDEQKQIAVNEARKKLRQYGSLAAELDSCDLPKECDDIMKAQLLLGFLANQPEEKE
jgi:hypothetical protein